MNRLERETRRRPSSWAADAAMGGAVPSQPA